MNRIVALVIVVVAVLFAGSSTLLVVDQRHQAVVYSRGGVDPVAVGPGLHFKLPTPLQGAMRVDARVQTLEASNPDRYTTSDKADLLVTPVLKYRVVDPLKLFTQTEGDAQSVPGRLAEFTRAALGEAFGKRSLSDALAQQHDIASEARSAIAARTGALGVEVVDVSLTRIDLPAAAAEAAYKRMVVAQEQAASDERAQGAAEAEQIKADAERQRDAVLADAYKTAQQIKGEGDAKAAAIAADAFGRDPGFYQFYQSLQAYRSVIKPSDVVVVDADNDFFRFMRSPDGGAPSNGQAAAASRKH
ncbi:protease modulator HflC [Trinickia fusca]|uniref:Protein HflC n=1 Tax=Trinickia fusca TaxID=2419777 RepID=A0A494XP55_9BURK|nr:protease modulator HflC [Trinickia fusca]RKP52430.1 protease modulator HflC [Trinickia fusca]